jgi:hypothetical protein
MTSSPTLVPALVDALADAAARAATAIAAEVPADVTVTAGEGAILLTGRELSIRALTDARLRDFAAIVRAAP